ncbi:MAG: hypothetical protein V3T77_00055 [Planctomycetota bacterium]
MGQFGAGFCGMRMVMATVQVIHRHSMRHGVMGLSLLATVLAGCAEPGNPSSYPQPVPVIRAPRGTPVPPFPRAAHPQEHRLRNVRQLTFGGENAEAYFSSDGKRLIFQSKRPPHECDQIYIMDVDGGNVTQVSSGKGRTTCAYFFYPNNQKVLYSSTHLGGDSCPPVPDHSRGYVWPVYDSYEIFAANADGSNPVQLTDSPGYDAEATLHPQGTRIVFTSARDGDLEIYSMARDGTDVKQLTFSPGYDGGPYYSRDGTMIVYRASRPKGSALKKFQDLLARALVSPSQLDLFVMNADGSHSRQVTDNGAANFCPFFHPESKRIIFSSNMHDPRGREFDLYMINIDGTGLERITFEEQFDGFPMFSPDGTTLVWCSNRYGTERGETNVFIAEWVE